MSMLLVVTHRLWSIIGDSGAVVSSVRPSALVPFSLHVLTGNLGSRPKGTVQVGSTSVTINGKPAARSGDTAMTCNDPVDAPVGTVVAVGTVMIGG
jgi:uncharacterized Zn-binding protein involved in type VI secretion